MPENNPKIIAVDFDGCLCQNAYPEIGAENRDVVDALRAEIRAGAKTILWTCREGTILQNAIDWCEERGIRFDTVNDHLPEMKEAWGNNPRKVFANEYWDDRAVRKPEQCHFTDCDGHEISSCAICGLELSPCTLREIETIQGDVYTIQILECKNCGTPSFAWHRTERR